MRQHSNHIITEQYGAVTLFDIQGDITHHSEPSFSKAFRNGDHQNHPSILLKIDKNAYINSGGISVLIQFLAKSKQNSQLVGITKFADIYDSVENAVEALSETACSRAAAR
jgi:anti-anti-sigma factor